MPEIVVLDLYRKATGMAAKVKRVDGSVIECPIVVTRDGSLGVKQPRGEWLVEPPPQPLEGQEALSDNGDAP